jgi:hypothetical protein
MGWFAGGPSASKSPSSRQQVERGANVVCRLVHVPGQIGAVVREDARGILPRQRQEGQRVPATECAQLGKPVAHSILAERSPDRYHERRIVSKIAHRVFW